VSQVLSSNIEFGIKDNIQAKFWISDKWFAVSSGDFNRMNLGHSKTSRYWKSDTQLLLLENDKNIIDQMKKTFEETFQPIDQGNICATDAQVLLTRIAKHNHLGGSADACRYLARFKSALLIKNEQDVRYVLDTAVELAKNDGKRRIEGIYMLMAIIIYNIQRREQTLDEIVEKLDGVESKLETEKTVRWMEKRGQLVKSGDVFRIAPNLKSKNQKTMTQF
jgi:CRISPR/Cas system CSM-associated protein Csm2 small subunit